MQPDVKKNKSYFSELGFKKTIDQLIKQIAELYVKDDIPWVVGYSGGKDSSACLQLMWQTLEYLKQNNKTLKPLYVITTDTLVENPIVSGWVKSSLHLLKTFPNNWRKKLKRLKTINWLKTNSIWNRRVLVNGRVVKNNNSIILASNIIKKSYGLELTTGEKAVESKLKKGEINADRHKKK